MIDAVIIVPGQLNHVSQTALRVLCYLCVSESKPNMPTTSKKTLKNIA